jgi:hypothetical protein
MPFAVRLGGTVPLRWLAAFPGAWRRQSGH